MEVCDEIAFVVDALCGTLCVRVQNALGYKSQFGQNCAVPPLEVLLACFDHGFIAKRRIYALDNVFKGMGFSLLEVVGAV